MIDRWNADVPDIININTAMNSKTPLLKAKVDV